MACSSFVQCLSTLVLGTDTHLSMFTSQYVSTLVLSTDHSSWLVYFLVHQYCSTRYGRLITACLFAQYVSTVVLGTDICQYLSTWQRHLIIACSSFVQCLSTLLPQYSEQTLATARLFAQYVSTVVLNTDNSSRLVLHFFSALVRQYLSTRYGQLIMACLFAQYVSTVVLGTDNSLRRVLHLFSALVCQYLSTWQRHLIIACSSFVQCLSTLLPQYSEQTLTTACLFAQYVTQEKTSDSQIGNF